MGRVYAVVSAKGGVGKTTTTTNLAAALAASGADVAVVDGDLGMANLAGSLGVDSAGATLHDVLAGEADIADATREGPHGMTVVPGSPDLDAFARADPEGLRDVLEALRAEHEYVLLDTGAGLSNDTVVPLTYVDEALLVSTTGRDALGDTEKTRQVAERLDITVAGAVITRVDPNSPQNAAVGETLKTNVLSSIPDLTVVRDAGDAGEPLTTYAPGSSAAAAYRALAADLTGESLSTADADGADEADEPADAGEADEGTDADASDDGDIIVADEREADDPLADQDESAAPEAPPEEDALVEVDVGDDDTADRGDDVVDADDDPLIETAEPDEEGEDAEESDDEGADADIEENDGDTEENDGDTEENGADEEDSDDTNGNEEEGVYTTSLADLEEDEEKKEKKGLFGRFLG